ncbi:hypothetical protein GGP62_001143 [Salinibacter ruber]|nr:hypothetical protein [Salinibacter ruber]MCS3706172.1 hypothetical protein [Salinibacter ruber]
MRSGPHYRRNGVARGGCRIHERPPTRPRTWPRTSSTASRTHGRRFCPPRAVHRGSVRRGQLKPAMLATVRPAERTRWARRCGAIETEMTCTASVAVYWTVQSSPPEGPASRFAGHTIRMRGREPRPPAPARARSERQPSSRRSSRCPQARIGTSDWAHRYDRGECPEGKTVLPPPVFRRLFFGLAAFPLRMRRPFFQFSFCSGDYFPRPTPNVMSI